MTSEGGTVEDGGTTTATATSTSVPPFLSKTYDMVDDPVTASTVSWSRSSNSFVVWNVPDFSTNLLPKYFKHSNFSSFVRQLNTYGFRKVHPDRFEFANEGFLRGQKHLLHTISRRKPAHGQQQPQQQQQPTEVQKSSTGACVELGKFGLEEEVERLKRDKNVLMQELVRLRQQQHATDHQLHTVGQRVQTMEQRQQQMMSFLAKAMHSPGFFAQLVQQQQNESNRSCISHGNKKRRLPSQEENSRGEVELSSNVPSEGQIVKFQPSMNEAAKAMMRQILKMDTSPRLEPSINGHDSLVISSSIPFSDSNDSGSTSCLTSGVTLSEVFPTSGMPHLPVELGISASCASTTVSELQSSPPIANGSVRAAHFPQDTAQPGFTQGEGTIKENMVEMPDWNFVGSETVDSGSMDMTTDLNGTMPLETIDFPPEPLVDGAPKLPGINDVFWEQFLAVSPLTGDTDEIDSSSLGGDHTNDQEAMVGENNRLDRIHHMDHLTEQMGLLASAGRSG